METPFCFDCRFFVPEGKLHNDLAEEQWAESLAGECRRLCPALGPMVTDRHGDQFRHFGEWPRVMAAEWCGRFEPKPPAVGPRTVRMARLAGEAPEG